MNIRRLIALTPLVFAPLAAQATLTTLGSPWPPGGSTGLEDVLFNVQTNGGVTVAMGAHPYKNGATMANDGVSTFYAPLGIYAGDGLGRANWSFDFAWDLGTSCGSCRVVLNVDQDPGAGVDFVSNNQMKAFGNAYAESWNLTMDFIPFAFDPTVDSSTAFLLQVLSGDGAIRAESRITVIAGTPSAVPEPASFALVGVALAGLGLARRRKT